MSFFYDQAQQLLQTAEAAETRLENEGKTLDKTTYENLDKQIQDLQDRTDDMIAADIKGTLAGLTVDEKRITQCTTDLTDAVKKVKTFDKIAALVGAGVELATAISCADPGQIFSALGDTEKALADAFPQVKNVVTKLEGDVGISSGGDS